VTADYDKPGASLYLPMFSACCLIFLWSLLFFNGLVGSTGYNVRCQAQLGGVTMNAKNSLGMSQFDGATVYAALAAFGVILVDRAIYRIWLPPSPSEVAPRRSGALALKLAMHLILTVRLHAAVFLPNLPAWQCESDCTSSRQSCTRSYQLQAYYALCCTYLLLSARQLRWGMELIVVEHPMTDSLSLFRIYCGIFFRSIPFVWEIRTLIDWSVQPTALTMFMWLKCEDIYSGLASVRVDMTWRRMYERGVEMPLSSKLFSGVTPVLLLLLTIVGPLIYFSDINPIKSENYVERAEAHLYLQADQPAGFSSEYSLGEVQAFAVSDLPPEDQLRTNTFHREQCCCALCLLEQGNASAPARVPSVGGAGSSCRPKGCECAACVPCRELAGCGPKAGELVQEHCGYEYLFSASWATQYSRLEFRPESEAVFSMSPEARAWLATAASVSLGLRMTVHRKFDLYSSPIQLQQAVELNGTARELLNEALRDRTISRDVPLEPFYPKFVRLPSVDKAPPLPLQGGESDHWHTQQPLALELRSAGEVQWWRLVQACSDPTTFGGEAGDGLRIVVATDWVFDSIGWNTMQQGSVLAFYGLIVYGVGRLVRSYVAGRRYGMVLDELVDSRDIHELLDGLYIARRRRDLLKETELYEATLRLYRSPETLLQLTGSDLKRE